MHLTQVYCKYTSKIGPTTWYTVVQTRDIVVYLLIKKKEEIYKYLYHVECNNARMNTDRKLDKS